LKSHFFLILAVFAAYRILLAQGGQTGHQYNGVFQVIVASTIVPVVMRMPRLSR